jgi:hypothetical protein
MHTLYQHSGLEKLVEACAQEPLGAFLEPKCDDACDISSNSGATRSDSCAVDGDHVKHCHSDRLTAICDTSS